MAIIPSAIPSQAYELIRNRIGEILIDELAEQATLQSDPKIAATVYIERFVAFDLTELPAVNVSLNTGNYAQQTVRSVDGTYRFNLDCHTSAKSTLSVRGDSLAMTRLQRLMATCQGILEDTRYKTLGFDAPFIERVHVESIDIAEPTQGDGTSSVIGRINFVVRAPNDRSTVTPTILAGYDTQVKLGLTEKGYIFSGDNIPVPPITGAEISVNETFYADAQAGDELDIPVVNSDGDEVGTVSAGVNVVVGDSTVNVTNSEGDPLATVTVVAEGSEGYVAPDTTIEVNGTTIGTVASGGTNNQLIRDTANNPVGTSANPSIVADATVQNAVSTPTWTDTVEAEGTLVLASASALQSDGVTVVLENYRPAADGYMFVCDSLVIPTISVTLSDPTPTFGDAINVTATPSGFTPTSYRFEVPTDFDNFEYVVQAGNVLSWTVNRLGSFTIRVEATDGSGNTAVADVSGVSPENLSDTVALVNDDSLVNGLATLPDGTPISTIENLVGDPYEQSTVARQPLYLTAGINGLPAWNFAATARHFYKTDASDVPEQVCITCVSQGTTDGVGGFFSVGGSYNDTSNPYLIMWAELGLQLRPYQRALGFNFVGRNVSVSTTLIVTMNVVISGGLKYHQLWVNGLMIFESRQIASATGTRTGEFIGHGLSRQYGGKIGHYERVNRACTAQEIKERHRLLMDKWL